MISYFPEGQVVGDYIQCGDIYGSRGKSFKYNLTNDLWCDFATGESGKGIESLLRLRGGNCTSYESHTPIRSHGRKRETHKEVLFPHVPVERPDRKFRIGLRPGGRYVKNWLYKNTKGEACFYVVRYDYEDGKETVPYSYTNKSWMPKAWPTQRPLFNSEHIYAHEKIMIVEGEKCADSVKMFPDYLGVTWSGGSNAIDKTDWTTLQGKEVVIIPDNDSAGYKAARKVAKLLAPHNKVRILNLLPLGVDMGYDLADMEEDGVDPDLFRKRYGF